MNKEEQQYLDLLNNILENGSERQDRTNTGTKSIFGTQLRFSLENNKIPLLTTKKMFLKGIIEELLFFIRGETDTKLLEEKGVNIWRGNTSRDFLDKKGLTWLKEGDMGYGYGWQWRSFGKEKPTLYTKATDYLEPGIDQLKEVYNSIKNDPYSRRHIVSAWNPIQLKETALPPCHVMYQFYVDNGTLSIHFNMRSVDAFLGLPFNLTSYAILTHLMAKATGLTAKDLIFSGGDTHIYLNHIDQAKEQLLREPYEFPQIEILKDISSIEDMEKLTFEDFKVIGYKSHGAIKAVMAV